MCKFCDRLKFEMEFPWPNASAQEYSAALFIRDYYNGEPRGATTAFAPSDKDFSVGFPLNFCPECGRKLNG